MVMSGDAKPVSSSTKIWEPGMPVNVMTDGEDGKELRSGKIFAVHPGDGIEDHDDPVQLTVALDGGENITVNEDEVEAK
jgi:hypothetical protein